MKNERPEGWVRVSLRHRLGLTRRDLSLRLRSNLMRLWLPRQIQFLSSGRRAGDWRLQDVRSAIAHPGVMRRRPFEWRGLFTEHAALPTDWARGGGNGASRNIMPTLRTGRAR